MKYSELSSELKNTIVYEMLHKIGGFSYIALCRKYGLSSGVIHKIVRDDLWIAMSKPIKPGK
jgi:Mor family transcriptional regulator